MTSDTVAEQLAAHAERVALNEAAFRRANELIRDQVATSRARTIPFLCECGRRECQERVELSPSEYESVRALSTWFFVLPGHEIVRPDVGRVVGREDRYTIVEKLGASAKIARELDPRGPAEQRAAS
jgi:hypothetical protein